MQKRRYAALAAALVMVLGGCGPLNSGTGEKVTERAAEISRAAEVTADDSTADELPQEDSKPESSKKPAHTEIGLNGAKAVTDVLLIPDEDIDISRKVRFMDMFGIHVLHTGVVGLVGAPVEVDFDTAEVDGGKLVFVYDPDALDGVRPDALMFLWYDEENGNYVERDDGVLNTDNCSVTLDIDKAGVYLLVNKYKWLNVWGAGLEDNGYEKDYDSSAKALDDTIWSRYEDVGDIPKLKDDDYIASCKQDNGDYIFDVSTPEQLASAVYTANCLPSEQPLIQVNIMNDIDLAGYSWASMGWTGAGLDYEFTGDVFGNGHTIKNMTINGGYHIGFIGCGCGNITDLNLENAYVSGMNAGLLVGYARNCYIVNCNVQGVTDGRDAGGIVSIDQSSEIVDCTADVIANGESLDGYLSTAERELEEAKEAHPPTEELWLDERGYPTRDYTLDDKYEGLGWIVVKDGEQILDRNAENETSLPWKNYDLLMRAGHYEVTLYASVDNYYIPITNTVEYDVE